VSTRAEGERRTLVVAALLLIGSASCASQEKGPAANGGPVAVPRVATRVDYQLGGPLRGPRAPGSALPADATNPAHALALDVSVIALASPPSWGLALVSSLSRVVLLEGQTSAALRATPRALADACAGSVEGPPSKIALTAETDPGARGRVLTSVRTCLIAGATTVIELIRDEPADKGTEIRHERAAILLGRRGDGKDTDAAIELAAGAGPPELALVAGSAFASGTPKASWVAVVPSPFEGEETHWLAFVAWASPGPVAPVPGAAAHEEIVASAVRELAAQAETAKLAVAPLQLPPELPDIDATRRSLTDAATVRRGLYSLAVATGARTSEALAIEVDDHTLAPIASAVAAALGSATHVSKPAEMGLCVERATLTACRQSLLTDPVPDDLPAALEWRGGAALRLLPSLAGELDKARTLDELESQIEALNIQLLLDASPTVRARAARWLGSRLSLEGYSPIASSEERRAAVERIRKHRTEDVRGPR
jgi:hypothetical protein